MINPPDACEREQALIQQELPFSEFKQSATNGLTLNITAPRAVDPDISMPVMVFVHGGGFANGSSSFPHYDLALITKMSIEAGMPVVSVGVK